jgi:glutamyl/glutaminyl-tRNA synthetase
LQNYYSELGYLPLAVLNFLLRNGSGIRNHDTHRLYSLEEMVESFDENLIGKSPFMMDMKELDRYGRMSFQKADFKTDLLPVIGVQFSLLNEVRFTEPSHRNICVQGSKKVYKSGSAPGRLFQKRHSLPQVK